MQTPAFVRIFAARPDILLTEKNDNPYVTHRYYSTLKLEVDDCREFADLFPEQLRLVIQSNMVRCLVLKHVDRNYKNVRVRLGLISYIDKRKSARITVTIYRCLGT